MARISIIVILKLFTDPVHSLLWFVSDQSQSLFKCDYSANVHQVFYLDELKYEGIVLDGDIVYLVNDATGKLYNYQIKKD